METLAVEIRAMRDELRSYSHRHAADHARLELIIDRDREEIDANTDWRLRRQGQEVLLRWLVGSNVGVIVALGALILLGLGVLGGTT